MTEERDPRKPHYAGRIVNEPLITCYRCEHHIYLGKEANKSATDVARAMGWKRIPAIGWICSECVDEP